MKGVNFVLDENNRKKAVIIQLETIEKYQEEMEDFLDGIIAEARKDEKKIPLKKVMENLKNNKKL